MSAFIDLSWCSEDVMLFFALVVADGDVACMAPVDAIPEFAPSPTATLMALPIFLLFFLMGIMSPPIILLGADGLVLMVVVVVVIQNSCRVVWSSMVELLELCEVTQ